jgi:hypothetical protein
MLTISDKQFRFLEENNWSIWVSQNVNTLCELLPDQHTAHGDADWRRLVEGILRRGELHGMTLASEAVAYCYGSLTLGIGFESQKEYSWAAAAMSLKGETRAQALWDGFEEAPVPAGAEI